MNKYDIKGMSCAACVARVEKAVLGVDGVDSCSVNLLTNSMIVEGDVSEEKIYTAVRNAGYEAKLNTGKKSDKSDEIKRKVDDEENQLKSRLISSVIILTVLMYFSMGHTMWGWSIPDFFVGNFVAQGILQLVLTILVMVINRKFFVSGFKGMVNKSPNMDSLVALGSGASFIYSLYILFLMSDAAMNANLELTHNYMHELYFESAAMILTLITVGKTLEAHSKGKTTTAVNALMNLSPKKATLICDNEEIEINADEMNKGDIFIVRPGESIPCDGVIISGDTAMDESFLTGESIPVDKKAGDKVSAGCINLSGFIKCEATSVGDDTALSKIIQMVIDSSSSKAPIAKIADKVSGVFVPIVIAISAITFVIWRFMGVGVGFSIERAISVLVISCPCALGLATPAAIMVGNGIGAKNGILYKTAVSLEMTGKANIVALDKTGTITKGEPEIIDIIPFGDYDNEQFMKYAYSLEKLSEHPLSKAIVRKAMEMNIDAYETTDFEILSGNGLSGKVNEHHIWAGKYSYVSKYAQISKSIYEMAESLSKNGKTILFFAMDSELMGIITVSDTVKDDSAEAVKMLKNSGLRVVMITGDNKHSGNYIGSSVGVDKVFSDVLPSDKEKIIKELRKEGKVIMVGDGINDAPALTSADVGIAIGAGTDVAIDAADIVLTKNSIMDVYKAYTLSRKVIRNIKQNLFWAFFYNAIGIPLAAGVFIKGLGLTLNPMFAAAAMSLSSFCVVSNALRLNFVKLNGDITYKTINEDVEISKGDVNMEKVLYIEGMMCPHCEKSVKDALEAVDGVFKAEPSHKEGKAVVTLCKEIDENILKDIVRQKGYSVK